MKADERSSAVVEALNDMMFNALDENDVEAAESMASVADSGDMPESVTEELYLRPLPGSVFSFADSGEPMVLPKNVHAGHRSRLKQRFRDEGLSSFQKHQILELLLFYAIPQKDTNELAHRLLNAYNGNLSEVLDADIESLIKIDGIKENSAILLSLMPQLFRVYREELQQREGVFGRAKVEQYIANKFTGEKVEKVLIACLDNKWNLLGCEFSDSGSVNFSSVNMRKIVEVCIRYNATKAIIAHNHPRGTALPSREDINTTIEVKRALNIIGVHLIDHMIVAKEDYISLACSKNYCEIF